MEDKESQSHGTLLKWILGIMLGCVSAAGGWLTNQMSQANARATKAADDSAEYLKELVKAEREELKDERKNNTAAIKELAAGVKGQTDFFGKMSKQLDTLISDTRAGVWRATPIPEPRPEP